LESSVKEWNADFHDCDDLRRFLIKPLSFFSGFLIFFLHTDDTDYTDDQ
jgi:hypothetical protein